MGHLSWSLADASLDVLGRLGLGAMALALDAAEEEGHDLSPLEGRYSSRDLELSWPDDVSDQDALMPLFEWAWQTRGAPAGQPPEEGLGLLYLPAVHRGDARDDWRQRLVEHSGILSTFLQHPRIQPKTKPKTAELHIDEYVVRDRYVEPKKELVYVKDAAKLLFRRGKLVGGRVKLSSYIRPGATARHNGEKSWEGAARDAMPLFFAPMACFFLQVRGADWVVVAPDPIDLVGFVTVRPIAALSIYDINAASAADAGLRVLVAMSTKAAARQLERATSTAVPCAVMRLGKVAWNKQSVRTRSLLMRPRGSVLDAYERVYRRLANRLVEKKAEGEAFVSVPSPRATIAENLVSGDYWYQRLLDVPAEVRDQVEDKRRKGESAERVWFRWVRMYRKELSALMEDLEQLRAEGEGDIDVIFRTAFHAALRSLYGREAALAERGSRTAVERLEDRTERIRRELSKAQTRQHVRGAIAEIFAEAGRNSVLQANAQEIWRFIDDREDWRRARDLALLSLATYARPVDRGENPTDEGEEPQ